MSKQKKNGFTLVELLAVIVILAVILVIAVPSIMSTIKESRKGAFASSAKLIASSAETAYISNQTLGIEKTIECEDVSNYTEEDYASCKIKFVDGKAKVKLVGQGKFEGMAVCSGTKEEAEVVEECPVPVSFANDSWATIKAAVDEGDTGNYNVGDIKTVNLGTTLGTHTVRIANKSACPTGDNALASQSACGFVIEFADIISNHSMNTSATNAGGWPASAMRTYVNGDIYNALPAELRDAIIDTKVVSGHGNGDTTGTLANNNFGSTDKVYLLSTSEVWGTGLSYDTAGGETITRQLDYYKNRNVTTSNYSISRKQNGGSYSYWWLRSAPSNRSNGFYNVYCDGGWSSSGGWYEPNAIDTCGVSPAFRLG